MANKKIYRLIDANIDRAKEALRVIDDSSRFIFDKKNFPEKIRNLRHEISNLPQTLNISPEELVASRDSLKDTGKDRVEAGRGNIQGIIASNFSRVEESIRVLEEYSRIISPKATAKIKKIRFSLYTLQKEVQLFLYRKKLVSNLGLYVITDEKMAGKSNEQIVREAVKGGVDTIQLRDKAASSRRLYNEAKKIRTLIPKGKALFVVNDRVDVALASDADGVHLGKDDLPIKKAREIMGEDKIIGVSCDNVKEAIQAEKDGADYVSLGPIFPTDTKKDIPSPLGVKVITEAKKKVSIPIVAIGGIDEGNIEEVLKAGADSVAVISALLKNNNIGIKVSDIKKKFLKTTS